MTYRHCDALPCKHGWFVHPDSLADGFDASLMKRGYVIDTAYRATMPLSYPEHIINKEDPVTNRGVFACLSRACFAPSLDDFFYSVVDKA